jgi:lysophospholipase L1-like esterase
VLVISGAITAGAAEPGIAPIQQHRFNNEILAYERSDQKLPPLPGGVLMVGSSSFRIWKTAEDDLAPWPIINRGFGGSTNADVLHFFDRIVTPYQPRVILYYEGDNDLAPPDADPQIAVDGFKAFADRVTKELPETRIVFVSIKPSGRRWGRWDAMQKANAAIRKLCDADEKLYYVDISKTLLDDDGAVDDSRFLGDRLHLKRETYHAWAAVIRPVLKKAWRAAGGAPRTFDRELKDGETIVFIGDSLTDQALPGGGYVLHTIQGIRKALPQPTLHFKRAGIVMTTSANWDTNVLDLQALRYKPTLSIVFLGTADMIGFFGKRNAGTPQAAFKEHMASIVKRIKASGSDVILMTPALLGEQVDPDRKGMRYMRVYCELLRNVAREQAVPLVDLHRAFLDYLREHKKDDTTHGLVTTDGIHFNVTGQEIVARELLQCLGLSDAAPAPDTPQGSGDSKLSPPAPRDEAVDNVRSK